MYQFTQSKFKILIKKCKTLSKHLKNLKEIEKYQQISFENLQ